MARFRYVGPRTPLAIGWADGSRVYDCRAAGTVRLVTQDAAKAIRERPGARPTDAKAQTAIVPGVTVVEVPDGDVLAVKAMRLARSIAANGASVPTYEEI